MTVTNKTSKTINDHFVIRYFLSNAKKSKKNLYKKVVKSDHNKRKHKKKLTGFF
jgi:hypothetical protein